MSNAQTFPEALYVHLPFCAALCTYCDFASEVYAQARARRYLDALEKEFAARVPTPHPRPLSPKGRGENSGTSQTGKSAPPSLQTGLSAPPLWQPRTIFLGGGTPSALNISELTRFFEILDTHVGREQLEEFTIEANPGSTDGEKLEFLLSRGVNRISFGVQSFQPHLLKLLGRVHGAVQGREAVRMARAAGFANVSIDLMHGLPTQTLDDVRRDLDDALALGTDHLSAYGLIYEDGTPLKSAVERRTVAPLSPEDESAHYRCVMETLERGGLPQYEVSNYARPGFEAKHNLVYWRNEAYLGLGVSAASFLDFERTVNFIEMDRYMSAAEAGGVAINSRETLDAEKRAREALILELRLRRGVDLVEFRERWASNPLSEAEAFDTFLREGLMERMADGRVRISREGMPVADGILAEFV